MKQNLKRSKLLLPFLMLLVMAISACSSSRRSIGIEEGWEILGEQKVNFVRDRDALEVRSRNQFTAIRFMVEEREIRLNDLKVTYQNGDQLSPAIDETITAGQTSRVIELAAEGKYIDKIEFAYRTTGNLLKGRGKVIILGKRYNPGY